MTLRNKWHVTSVGIAVIGVVALALYASPTVVGARPHHSGGTSGLVPPTAKLPTLKKIGKGEGHLNLIAWEGYAQPTWVKPFEQKTGCQVNVKYATTSSAMVSLMANGGGSQYDLVSASGDASLRLIYAGDVRPVNMKLIPDWKEFDRFLQSPPFNTIHRVHYGVSNQFGPNVLLYSTKVFKSAPKSWSVVYSKKYAGEITIPTNPIQIATAALFLSYHNKSLGITDPYELTQKQFTATVKLLKQEHPLVKKYWAAASQEVSLFASGTAVVGAAWPYQTNALQRSGYKVAATIPEEGVTGWATTWMLAAKAPDPNCAYKWMNWVSTPQVQAEQAISYGETPVNKLACPIMNTLQKGGCTAYHAHEPASYYATLKYWKTPLSTCDNGKKDCVPFQDWVNAWTQITG